MCPHPEQGILLEGVINISKTNKHVQKGDLISIFGKKKYYCMMAVRHALYWSASLIIFSLYLLMFNPTCISFDRNRWGNVLDQFTAGKIVSTVSVGTPNIEARSKPMKDPDLQSCYLRLGSIIAMFKYTLAASLVCSCQHRCAIINLCGDIQPNRGPAQGLENASNLNAYFDLQPRGLRAGQWNVNHLNDSKLEEIKLALLRVDYTETHIDFLVINETFWDSATSLELFTIPGYNLFRRTELAIGRRYCNLCQPSP